MARTYHELANHQDEDAAVGGGLRIRDRDLVLDLLEREALQGRKLCLATTPSSLLIATPLPRPEAHVLMMPYHKLLGDFLGTKRLVALKREHRVLPLLPSPICVVSAVSLRVFSVGLSCPWRALLRGLEVICVRRDRRGPCGRYRRCCSSG